MLPDRKNGEKHLALVIELPCMYTADIDSLREVEGEFPTESEFLLNVMGEPTVVRLRTEISGEKDSDIIEVWGMVREAKLVEPSRGYGDGPHLTDDQLADHGSKLMRDENACEWCQHYDSDAKSEER